jgi:hypothetical protein
MNVHFINCLKGKIPLNLPLEKGGKGIFKDSSWVKMEKNHSE